MNSVNLTILKLFDANTSSETGYDLEKKCICELDPDAPTAGSYRVINDDEYWGIVSTRDRSINGVDDTHFFFFHNKAVYNFSNSDLSVNWNYLSKETAEFIVNIQGKEKERQLYSRLDNFDVSGWMDEEELDIFAIIYHHLKNLNK